MKAHYVPSIASGDRGTEMDDTLLLAQRGSGSRQERDTKQLLSNLLFSIPLKLNIQDTVSAQWESQ